MLPPQSGQALDALQWAEVVYYPQHLIIELIVHGDQEIGYQHFQELEVLVASLEPRPLGLLANRRNKYAMNFSATRYVIGARMLKFVAVLSYGRTKPYLPLTEFLNMKAFSERNLAVAWLKQQIAQ